MENTPSIVKCEISKADNYLFFIYYKAASAPDMRNYLDVLLFCCFTIRQLVNFRIVDDARGAGLAQYLLEVTPDMINTIGAAGVIHPVNNPVEKGPRIESVLLCDEELRFQCNASGFGVMGGRKKVEFADNAVKALYYFLSHRDAWHAEAIGQAARACGACYVNGFHSLVGEFSIANQLGIALAIASEVWNIDSREPKSSSPAHGRDESDRSSKLPELTVKKPRRQIYTGGKRNEDAERIRKEAIKAEKERERLLERLRERGTQKRDDT